MEKWAGRFAPALILFAITIAVNWKLALTNGTPGWTGRIKRVRSCRGFKEAKQIRQARLWYRPATFYCGLALAALAIVGLVVPRR